MSVRQFIKKHGATGMMVYLSVSALTFGSAFFALKSGVDVQSKIQQLGFEQEWMKSGGNFAIAYGIYKLTMPARLTATLGITGFLGRLRK